MAYLTAEQRKKIEDWIHSVSFGRITQNKNENRQNNGAQQQQPTRST